MSIRDTITVTATQRNLANVQVMATRGWAEGPLASEHTKSSIECSCAWKVLLQLQWQRKEWKSAQGRNCEKHSCVGGKIAGKAFAFNFKDVKAINSAIVLARVFDVGVISALSTPAPIASTKFRLHAWTCTPASLLSCRRP